jgi:hypothetical protein
LFRCFLRCTFRRSFSSSSSSFLLAALASATFLLLLASTSILALASFVLFPCAFVRCFDFLQRCVRAHGFQGSVLRLGGQLALTGGQAGVTGTVARI